MIKVIVCDDHPIFREGLKKTSASSETSRSPMR